MVLTSPTEPDVTMDYLRQFYDQRAQGLVCLVGDDGREDEINEYLRAGRSLGKRALIEWVPVMGLPIGYGRITPDGIAEYGRLPNAQL